MKYSYASLNDMSKDEFDSMMEIGLTQAKNGESLPAEDVFDSLLQDNFNEANQAVRQAKAMTAFTDMRKTASSKGYMTEEEINAEIQKARNEA